jgi:DNA-binding phage protein
METSRFNISDYLDSNEMIAEYLNTIFSEVSKPQFDTVMKVLRAIGGQIQINPMTA